MGRELASLSKDGITYSYKYNYDGLRTYKSDGTNTYNYIWQDGKLISQTGAGNTLKFIYENEKPTAINYNGTEYYYVTNLQGDVIAILDKNGNCVVEYTYDAWGKIISTTGALATTLGQDNPLRYRGYYYDTETSFYYLQSRYYDPTVGRFINADEVGYLGVNGMLPSYNLFAYCENNPVLNSDYTGQFVIRRWMIAAVIDFLLMLIPGIGSAFAPVKAFAKKFSKKALKLKIKTPLINFIKGVAKLAKTIIGGIQKGLSKLWGIGKWLASKIPVTKLSNMLAGLATSVLLNKILNILIENIDMVLSLGGAISGVLDYAFDKKINNSIWVI